VQLASINQVDQAIDSAKTAFNSWKNSSLYERIEILTKFVEILESNKLTISQILSQEVGKFPKDAHSEVERSIGYTKLVMQAVMHMKGSVYYGDGFEKYAHHKKTGFYERKPLGVVLAISPFNYPLNLSVTKIIPAIISGNTVVLKPATQGSIATIEFYKYIIDAGLPAGVLNIITGNSSEIGDYLPAHKDIALIAFTGSTEVGKHIGKLSTGIPIISELGGKDAAIVSSNADLDLAVSEIATGAFSYSGQRCTAQKIVFVDESIADKFVDMISDKVSAMELNPMINQKSADYIEDLYNDALSHGAKVIRKIKRVGNVFEPIILDEVTEQMRVYHEEQFGPIMPIVRVKNTQEAVERTNNLLFGLQASVYTKDIDEAFACARMLEVGTVQINAKPDRGPDNFPFGGTKDSGQYMQGTIETIELMTRGKMTVLNT
jgi:glyceraldehyde-3-phosphate dehydrogenase (NADP+)